MRTLLVSALLAGFLAACASAPPPKPRIPANTLADQAMAEGRMKEAIELYTQWLIDHPQDFTAHFRRAQCLERVGETDLAIEGYSKTLELKPDLVAARLRRAGCYYSAKDMDRAEGDLNEVMGNPGFESMAPGDQTVAYGLAAQIALRKNLTQIAVDHLDRAVDVARKHKGQVRGPQYRKLLYNRAMALFALGAYPMALGDFEEYAGLTKELGHDPGKDDLYHLVLLNYLTGRFEKAKELMANLGRADRNALAAKLDDPGFFAEDPATVTPAKQ